MHSAQAPHSLTLTALLLPIVIVVAIVLLLLCGAGPEGDGGHVLGDPNDA